MSHVPDLSVLLHRSNLGLGILYRICSGILSGICAGILDRLWLDILYRLWLGILSGVLLIGVATLWVMANIGRR